MPKVVIDSDIFIDLLRTGKGGLATLFELQEKREVELYLSTVTIMEIFSGQSSKEEEEKLLRLLENFVIIPFTFEIAKLTGEIRRKEKISGLVSDLIIAATTISLDAELATKNKKHFSQIPKLKFFKF